MTEADTDVLSKLTPEQLAVLSDDLKAAFCLLSESDQTFFASTFSPASLPGVLSKKAELIKRSQAESEQYQALMEKIARSVPADSQSESGAENVLAGVATALGIGAATAAVVTDNTAFYEGVVPSALIPALQTEFQNQKTSFSFAGDDEKSITATVSLSRPNGRIPAMTINLTKINDGCEVKVNDLTASGILETIKSGGEMLMDIAGQGLNLLNRKNQGNLSAAEVISTAKNTLDTGTSLAEDANNLNLKERAWKVIRPLAESIESQARAEKDAALARQMALEKAWDNYNVCPTCGVAFAQADTTCRLCGSARPQIPVNPDPRQQI